MQTRTILADAVEMEIVIKFEMVTGEVSLTGCDKNALVALGMLDYALSRVRRALAIVDLQKDAANAPRVALASQVTQ